MKKYEIIGIANKKWNKNPIYNNINENIEENNIQKREDKIKKRLIKLQKRKKILQERLNYIWEKDNKRLIIIKYLEEEDK